MGQNQPFGYHNPLVFPGNQNISNMQAMQNMHIPGMPQGNSQSIGYPPNMQFAMPFVPNQTNNLGVNNNNNSIG
jgi:hypothetical protein